MCSKLSSTQYTILVTMTAITPTIAPSRMYNHNAVPAGWSSAGIEKIGAAPSKKMRAPAALHDANATGTRDRGRNSNSNNSTASSTALTGVPNVAAIPAAAPQASNVLRSVAVVRSSCPTNEPSAPPVAMIGPSAPNGPPVPIAIAALRGFRNVSLGGIRLSSNRTFSMASGIPWPRIALDPYRAMMPTIMPPITGTPIVHHGSDTPINDADSSDQR